MAAQHERWLALELITVMVTRTVQGFRDEGGLLGASNYAAMFVAYALLAVLVMYEPTAELAVVLGAMILAAVLLHPTGKKSASGVPTVTGVSVAGALADFATKVQTGTPKLAKGVGG